MAYPTIPGMKTEPVAIPIVDVTGEFEAKWTPTLSLTSDKESS